MVKKATYEQVGDELDSTTAFIQASSALDVAAGIAIKKDDSETLLSIASLWMQMSDRLGAATLEEEEEEVHDQFGFCGAGEVVQVELDEIYDEEDEDEEYAPSEV